VLLTQVFFKIPFYGILWGCTHVLCGFPTVAKQEPKQCRSLALGYQGILWMEFSLEFRKKTARFMAMEGSAILQDVKARQKRLILSVNALIWPVLGLLV